MRTSISCFIIFVAIALVSGCSENNRPRSLEEGFLNYNEVEMVPFSLSGNVKCTNCSTDEDDIVGIEIEVRLVGDPTHVMAVQLEDDLGYFQMNGLRAPDGFELEVRALMRTTSMSNSSRSVSGRTSVPDDGDGVATITLDFTNN